MAKGSKVLRKDLREDAEVGKEVIDDFLHHVGLEGKNGPTQLLV